MLHYITYKQHSKKLALELRFTLDDFSIFVQLFFVLFPLIVKHFSSGNIHNVHHQRPPESHPSPGRLRDTQCTCCCGNWQRRRLSVTDWHTLKQQRSQPVYPAIFSSDNGAKAILVLKPFVVCLRSNSWNLLGKQSAFPF
jgi:hypothetical protein